MKKGGIRAVLAFFLGLVFLLFAPFFLRGEVFVPGDIIYFLYPWKTLDHTEPVHNLELIDVVLGAFYPFDTQINANLKQGELPLWNPQIFSGHPLIANGQSGLLYLPRLLAHKLLSPGAARTIVALVHMLAAGLLMTGWLRSKGLAWMAASMGGLCWLLNGYVIGWMEFEHMPIMATYLPLMLLCVDRALLTGAWKWWSLLVISGAMSLLGGHLHINLYVGLLVALYVLFQVVRGKLWADGFRLLLAAVGVLAVAAPALLPFLELAGRSQRAPMDLSAVSSSLWEHLPTLICPDIWGSPATNFMFNRCQANLIFPEFACYFGATGLLLALVALFCQKCAAVEKSEIRFWGVIMLGALIAASAFPPFGLIASVITPLSKLIPGRALVMFCFAGSVLAAMGAQMLLEAEEKARRLLLGLGMALSLCWGLVVAAVVTLVWTRPAQATAWILGDTPERLKLPARGEGDFAAQVLSAASNNYLWNPQFYLPVLTGAVIVGLCIALGRKRLSAKAVGGTLLLVAATELLLFATRYNPHVAPERLFVETPGIKFLTEQTGLFRVQPRHAAFYNSLMPYDLQLFAGYESMIPARFFKMLRATQPNGRVNMRTAALQDLNSPILDAFNVRYAILPPMEELKGERWSKVYDGELKIYENKTALERAYVVGVVRVAREQEQVWAYLASPQFDPHNEAVVEQLPPFRPEPQARESKVEVLRYSPDHVSLKVSMTAPGLLVLADSYYPGWECTVDAEPAEIMAVNGAARGVYLPQGEFQVDFRFNPRTFRKGLNLCAATLMILLCGMLVSWWRGRGKEPSTGSLTDPQ